VLEQLVPGNGGHEARSSRIRLRGFAAGPLPPDMRAQPLGRQIRHALERPQLLEHVGGPGHDLEPRLGIRTPDPRPQLNPNTGLPFFPRFPSSARKWL
jgi:hypothetical protein